MVAKELRGMIKGVLEYTHISKEEVLEVFRHIKGDILQGPDQVYPRTCRDLANKLQECWQ